MSLRTRLARWKRAWQYSTGPVDPKYVQPPSGD